MFGEHFGGELVDLVAIGLGVATADFVDQKFLFPIANRFLPASGFIGTMVDAGTTWVSGVVIGKLVGLASKRFGEALELGGKIAAVAKGISAFVPSFSLGSPLPIFAGNNMQMFSAPGNGTAIAGATGAAGVAAGASGQLPAGSPANGVPVGAAAGSAEDADL